MDSHNISIGHLSLSHLFKIISENTPLSVSETSVEAVTKCRSYLDKKLKDTHTTYYGINTGFGSLHNVRIDASQIEQLQENLVMSHACGTGAEVPEDIVRIMLLLKIQSLSYGHSGIDIATLWRLVDFYNLGIYPVIYEQGSLGASGDLAPLAHLSLPLLGKGTVNYQGERLSGDRLKDIFKFNPLKLQSKEGLALLNGTQFMGAYGVWCLQQAYNLLNWADIIACMGLEAFDGRIEPFTDIIHNIRPHYGQKHVAEHIANTLRNSLIMRRAKEHVQDPYSFRCIPQVHGATHDAITYVAKTFETEINSVTDNPLIFPDEDKIISGGNFHGQTLAIALDTLTLAMSEIASISERRIFKLISGERGLPPYLIKGGGLNSGFMIPQYTAASIVSQNKQLCTPASADSIVSSNGQEDHVSMGANAATKCYKVVQNVKTVLAIEIMCAAQAMDFRDINLCSDITRMMHQKYREYVPHISADTVMYELINKSVEFISTH